MERVSPKEKSAIVACIFVATLMLVARIYGFIFAQNSLADLLGSMGQAYCL